MLKLIILFVIRNADCLLAIFAALGVCHLLDTPQNSFWVQVLAGSAVMIVLACLMGMRDAEIIRREREKNEDGIHVQISRISIENRKGLLEVPVGVTIDDPLGRIIAVENKEISCEGCILRNTLSCSRYRCAAFVRKDNTDIHFERAPEEGDTNV